MERCPEIVKQRFSLMIILENYMKIAFFDSRKYDIESFESMNKDYGFTLKFFEDHLSADTLPLA